MILSPTDSVAQQDNRKAWQFETAAGTRTIADQGDGKWVTYFPNGTTVELVEVRRNAEFVEIRNPKNGFVQRLFQDRGLVQKTANGSFRTFGQGSWLIKEFTRARLDPAKTDYKVRVVYLLPNDRKPTNEYK